MQSYLQAVDIPAEIYNEFQRAIEQGAQDRLNLNTIDINTLIIKKAQEESPIHTISLVPSQPPALTHVNSDEHPPEHAEPALPELS